MGAVRPAEAVRLWVQYVRRSQYVRERSQYVSRRQYGRGDSTSVGGSTAAEAVRQSEAVRPSGTVRQLDLCGAVGLAAVDGDESRGNASVCLKSSPVKSCDEGREAAQDKDSRRLRKRRRWRFEAKTVDGSFAQRQGRRYGWYAWTGTVPLFSGMGGVRETSYISRLNRQRPVSRPARRLHSSWMVSAVTSQGMCIAGVKPGGGRGAYAWTDNCNLQPLVHHLSFRGGD